MGNFNLTILTEKIQTSAMKVAILIALVAISSAYEFTYIEKQLHDTFGIGTNPTHYGNPTGGCMSDEMTGKIQGVDGDACLPKCTGVLKHTCPTDYPAGDTAQGMCILKDQSGDHFCVLVCKGQATGTCPTGASCEDIQGIGICMYPTGKAVMSLDLHH